MANSSITVTDPDAEILARFRDTPHTPVPARSGLDIVREDCITRKRCDGCGRLLILATTENHRRVPLMATTVPARWLLVQRSDDGLFWPCPSRALGYTLHVCPTRGVS